MANTKNTIQNIPLTGPLCLNKLKTDVTQFEGYNEKNTTVFGGELTPLWENEEEITSTDYSYTIYNSKGHRFTLEANQSDGGMHLFGPDGEITDSHDQVYAIPFTTELDLPVNAIWGGMFVASSFKVYELCLGQDYKFYYRGVQASDSTRYNYAVNNFQNEINKQPWTLLTELLTPVSDYSYRDFKISGGYYQNKIRLFINFTTYGTSNVRNNFYYLVFNESSYAFTEDENARYAGEFSQTYELDETPNFIMSINEIDLNEGTIYITYTGNSDDGRGDSSNPYVTDLFTFNNNEWVHSTSTPDKFAVMNAAPIDRGIFFTCRISDNHNNESVVDLRKPANAIATYNACPYSLRQLVFSNMNKTGEAEIDILNSWSHQFGYYTGHDSNGYLPTLMESDTRSLGSFNFVCRDNYLTAITFGGVHISAPTTFTDNYVTISKSFTSHCIGVNYKSGNKWYCFMSLSGFEAKLFSLFGNADDLLTPVGGSDLMKNLIIDNRYILMLNAYQQNTFLYDIEKEGIIYDGYSLGYVDTKIPVNSSSTELTSACYAGGFNAGFEKNQASFIGFLENPSIILDFPGIRFWWLNPKGSRLVKDVQSYCTLGDEVQSASYVGGDSTYFGTTYPIDPNGNSILPYSLNSKIINGYSNNDMIKVNDTAYPLMYYNTNQKVYAYQRLSSMEGVEGIFSLQGQQYTFDDNNIYNVTYQNGIRSNTLSICYKKNLTFLGTLPTAAIFYSFYNKTFYQFTGDAIVSKMFEANDITEIYSVAQNPSTLSLWICTDQGIYVMSDTDMFKLNYVSREPAFFQPESTYVVEGEKAHRIAFYKQNDEAEQVPIKLATKYYGLGSELKANMDCWYIRLHDADHKNGKLRIKVNTITNVSFETEEKVYEIARSMYDVNNQVYIRYQPKYQSAVAMQLELESDIAIYQISLGVNATDAVAQQSKFNF